MKPSKIKLNVNGKLNTTAIAEITEIFSQYRINILDINMHNDIEEHSNLIITFQSSSTTDEIDSFWNDISKISNHLSLNYSHNYID